MPKFNVSNVFECGRKNPDVSYERSYMATEGNVYFAEIIDHLNVYQDRHGQRLSSKNIKEAVFRVTEQQEEEIECNINNITCDTSFQPPVTMNVQKKYENWSLERRLAAGGLDKMVKEFKGCTIQSDEQIDTTIDSEEHVDARNWLRNDSAEQVDAIIDSKKLVVDESNPKSDPIIATHTTNGISDTHTTNGISTQKLFINPTIQAVVRPITPLVTPEVEFVKESLRPRHSVLPQANVTDAARPCAHIFWITGNIIGTERD